MTVIAENLVEFYLRLALLQVVGQMLDAGNLLQGRFMMRVRR
jgi:hypothetical protein